MYIPFFFVICLMYIQASPPTPHHLTESCLCVIILEAPKNAQAHVKFLALLLFPHAEQMRQFILLCEKVGQ
jgi:hypothetical protein